MRTRKAREGSNRRCWPVTDELVLKLGDVAVAVGAVVALDLPPRDAQLLSACGEVAGGAAWADEVVPAVLARMGGDAEFGDAHCSGSSSSSSFR